MKKEEAISDLNPRFIKKAPSQYKNSYQTNCATNFYQIVPKTDLTTIYQYSVDFEPVLPENSSKVMEKVIKTIIRDLKAKIGFICYKGAMMWGTLNLKLALNIKTQITNDKIAQGYQVMLKPCKIISIDDFFQIDSNNSIMLAQVLNIRLKQDLKSLGFKQLDKGKYYKDSDFQKDKITSAGLSVWRGYSVTVQSINSKLHLKIDPCSRVLRIQNFLETMRNTKKYDNIHFLNQMFTGASVITRYGTHRMNRIQEIVYSKNPKSLFMNSKQQKQNSFIEYFKENYQVNIKDEKQPLIRVRVRNGPEWQDQYLVPQLVSLTGITDEQRANFQTMKAINQKTKLSVAERIKQTNTLITLLQGVKQSIFQINKDPLRLKGDVLGAPLIELYDKDIKPQNGSFQLRDKILDPINLKNYYFVYSSRNENDDRDADATLKFLNDASRAYGIKLANPIFIDIICKEKLTPKDWITEIDKTNKARKQQKREPIQFAIIYFNQEQRKRKELYGKIKDYLNNIAQIPSQVITKKTLAQNAKGAISKASKILLQINDKLGHPLYKINKNHAFWQKNKIAIGALSISSGSKGIIASLVGTRNNEGTLTFSHYQKVQKKEVIPQMVINQGIIGWLKQYFIDSKKSLPGTIVLYRQGLNEKQINKVVEDEIKAIKNAFQTVSAKAKVQNYQPNLIYLLVNMRNGTRVYEQFKKGQFANPLPGTIIGEALSKDNSYQFLMASTSTTEGTCNMVQYKVLYDSSNQKVPHEAIKMITYEQCYNYPNWAGSIRFPGVLQKANKLSKFQSQNGGQKMAKQNLLRNLDYYI